MEQYIPKADVVEEIERIQKTLNLDDCGGRSVLAWSECLKKFLNTLEVKEAIDGIAIPDDGEIWCNLKSFNLKEGNKIKVILIKED